MKKSDSTIRSLFHARCASVCLGAFLALGWLLCSVGVAQSVPGTVAAAPLTAACEKMEGSGNAGTATFEADGPRLKVAGAVATPFAVGNSLARVQAQVRLLMPDPGTAPDFGSAMLALYGKERSQRLLAFVAFVAFKTPSTKPDQCEVGFIAHKFVVVPAPFGKWVTLEPEEAKPLAFVGMKDGVRYRLAYAVSRRGLAVTATLENTGAKSFAPPRVPLILGIDSFMNAYPQWNELYFPTFLRCEPTHFWGYPMSPHGRILAVGSPDPVGSYTYEYLCGVVDDLGAGTQLLEWPGGRLRQAFVVDPHVANTKREPDPANPAWGRAVPVVTCEDYIETIGEWWGPSNKGTTYLERAEWGWSGDGIPYEIFKAMEEIAVTQAFVLERADGSLVGYNCRVAQKDDHLEVKPAEAVVRRVHVNLKNPLAVRVIFAAGPVVSEGKAGLRWITAPSR